MKLIEIDPKNPKKIIRVLKNTYLEEDHAELKERYVDAVKMKAIAERKLLQMLTTLLEGDIIEISRANGVTNRNCIVTALTYNESVAGPIPLVNIVLDIYTAAPAETGKVRVTLRGTPFSIGYTKEFEKNPLRVTEIIKRGHADLTNAVPNY